MKRDTEIIRDLLLWLLDDPNSSGPAPFGTPSNVPFPAEGEADLSGESWDPFESEAFAIADPPGLLSPGPNPHPVSLGEIPAVQDHFQALIKRRLRLEIERRPPLFPWEHEVQDYPEWLTKEAVVPLWVEHLRTLKLPTLPDDVMAALLERCQALASQPLKTGVRLVRAVETLFPEQPQTLENVARLVLTPAYRSGRTELPSLDYSAATSQQQVALAMLAAQEIFNALSLPLSPQAPTLQRQWMTPLGVVALTATYQPEGNGRIQIRAVLPQAGYLQLADSHTAKSQPGEVVAVLEAPISGQIYPLTVGLLESESAPLQFSLLWLADQNS